MYYPILMKPLRIKDFMDNKYYKLYLIEDNTIENNLIVSNKKYKFFFH